MKESKKRENPSSKKKKHGNKSVNLDSWDQSDLEFADEKVLERRLHQLKLQLQMAQEETPDPGRSSKHTRNKKKPLSDDTASSDSDSSDSDSSFSSASSSSADRYNNKKSSSASEDDRKRRQRNLLNKKKAIKESKTRRPARNDRENNTSKNDKKIVTRRKTSPILDKHSSRVRPKRSPSLDKKELYSRMDTSRWHDKAKEIGRERSKHRENDNDRSRGRSRTEQNRSESLQKDQRTVPQSKARNAKKTFARNTSVSSRRKDSPEPARTRVGHDTGRRAALFTRKISPKEERLGRHDDRRLDLKMNRRNEIRSGDTREVNVRITKETRDRKEPVAKAREKSKDREMLTKSHRESAEYRNDTRDRGRAADDRVKERDKRLHDRMEPDRNFRNVRNDNRDVSDDKFRRLERSVETNRGNARHANESVFDRMRNRYNDRRNAENQRFGRIDRERVNDIRKDRINDKEPIKPRSVESNDADRIFRDRRTNIPVPTRIRSPHRDRKEPFRNIERRTPVNYERKFSSPTANKKVRDDNRPYNKRKSLENDDLQWNKKKGLNKTKSRSRSSERRKRRRSSQEEWRIIDMTSPLLDDELSDENANKGTENNIHNRLKRPTTNRIRNKMKNEENDDNDASKLNKTILTDELSDISDEDFNDANATNLIKNKKDVITKPDRQLRTDKNNRKVEPKNELEFNKKNNQDNKNSTNDVDDLINNHEKLNDESNGRVDIEKNEHLDSEEETVSRVSDAIGVDWAELVEDSKKKIPDVEESSKLVRKQWSGMNIFAKIGISEKYAGKDLFEEVQKDLSSISNSISENKDVEKPTSDETDEKILHKIPGLHVCLRDRAMKRRTLFEPYKTAISARKDIIIRRRLCGLPVKNINAQHMTGICHWIV